MLKFVMVEKWPEAENKQLQQIGRIYFHDEYKNEARLLADNIAIMHVQSKKTINLGGLDASAIEA